MSDPPPKLDYARPATTAADDERRRARYHRALAVSWLAGATIAVIGAIATGDAGGVAVTLFLLASAVAMNVVAWRGK